ncbi:uncharacterized protein ARMOST_05087 [Armillaria ostoyae]|uniref:Yeast cell wall synthesis Kre9/Knh1-like N-terminal domain-containing protein n=1 Tax=Armillaria ostoyae TaxID=47428 RepID=A0A284QZ60_ARMOS|nr:uncharacterized protein ARMOST_05087 [Armillaria ostoyae]
MRTAAVLIACATSALAYTVTVPNASQGWTNSGSQTVSWQKVSTDRDNFTIVLTNQASTITWISADRSVLSLDQTLASLVDGNLGTQQVNPPGGGWIVGGTYRVNLVQDSQSLNSILAQSSEFNITESSSSSSSATGSSTSITRISTTAALTTATGTTLIATTGAASGASSSASSTGAATTSNAALPVSVSSSGFVGLLALLGAMLF